MYPQKNYVMKRCMFVATSLRLPRKFYTIAGFDVSDCWAWHYRSIISFTTVLTCPSLPLTFRSSSALCWHFLWTLFVDILCPFVYFLYFCLPHPIIFNPHKKWKINKQEKIAPSVHICPFWNCCYYLHWSRDLVSPICGTCYNYVRTYTRERFDIVLFFYSK